MQYGALRTDELYVLVSVAAGDGAAFLELIHWLILEEWNENLSYGQLSDILTGLEADGLIEFRWGEATPVQSGRARKIYTITQFGRVVRKTNGGYI